MSTNYIDQITDTAGTTHDISESDSTRLFRATCSTAAATAAKVATLDTSNRNFSLTTGVRVAVTFKYGNSATTTTLNVESTGAKTIETPTSVSGYSSSDSYNTWGAYETVIFTYNGTYWIKGSSSYSVYTAETRAQKTVRQSAIDENSWRRILGSYNTVNTPSSTTANSITADIYFDADGPAINPSTGVVYGKNYWANLDATEDATLIARLNAYGWSDCIIT